MMRIVGYTDRISVQPGQKIGFKVSSQAPAYRAGHRPPDTRGRKPRRTRLQG